MEVRDEHGVPIEDAGEPGDLFLSGPSVATGYWCRTETTRAVFQGEWLRTGDTYVRNEDGTYTCLGRSNDMLKAGGIWVSPIEVEATLIKHAAVLEVAVVGREDSDRLVKPHAFVVLKEPAAGTPALADEMKNFVKDKIALYKYPSWIDFVTELPRTPSGKVLKRELRERFSS